ncbi:MAG: hypothetical protein IKK98_06310 [Oscillospiraceae bacterium]|nr:hypothetical protein [Oscillospiraceae bacterium]MBQ2793015.1 hypothetical protein [Oscillospiraceae bacterium]MBQ3241353.1 hypothetical protein [Oscillospiraceae bacterium]MBR2635841.1 hypothetical protein [Oscillospiraceae bacterium]MBR6608254.1 hypothetical protein [Oscillospiraceae bacterium]
MPCCENNNKTWIIILALILLYVLYCDIDLCGLFTGNCGGCGNAYNNCSRTPYCCD